MMSCVAIIPASRKGRPPVLGLAKTVTCKVCDKPVRSYESRKRTYCSAACRLLDAYETKPCGACGHLMRRKKGHYRMYCSRLCYSIGRRLEEGMAARNEVVFRYKRQAKERNLEWLLTDIMVDALFKNNCHWCGEPPSNSGKRARNYGDFRHSGIDRVDNNKGYVEGNVVSCCIVCNSMKRDFTEDVFLDRARRIAKRFP